MHTKTIALGALALSLSAAQMPALAGDDLSTSEVSATDVRRAGRCRRSRTAVMTPSVPSDPHSSAPKSYPVLSLSMPERCERTVPSASTASMPTTCSRVMPKATTWMPPALVATVPPTVRLITDNFGRKDGPILFGWVFVGHQLGASTAAVLAQDSYYIDQSARFTGDGESVNFDHPEALDFPLLARHLAGDGPEPVTGGGRSKRAGRWRRIA